MPLIIKRWYGAIEKEKKVEQGEEYQELREEKELQFQKKSPDLC